MRLRWLALAALALLATLLAAPGPVNRLLFHENLIAIVPGAVYRSAQPSGAELEELIGRLGLRSVLNLRGERGGSAWLAEERAVTQAHGTEHHTVRLSAKRMPPTPRLREIVEILDTAPRPLLVHCQGGVERSGLAGAVAVLLDGGDLDAARAQFSPSKGFVSWISRSHLPRVVEDYAAWLAGEGLEHSPQRFRRWVGEHYHPYFYRARIVALNPPLRLPADAEHVLRVRVTNDSREPIGFRANRASGVHLGAVLRPAAEAGGEPIELRDGFVDLDLAPGASHELELVLPPLAPGRWRLRVDLVDEGVKWFEAMGSEPLRLAFEVGPPA